MINRQLRVMFDFLVRYVETGVRRVIYPLLLRLEESLRALLLGISLMNRKKHYPLILRERLSNCLYGQKLRVVANFAGGGIDSLAQLQRELESPMDRVPVELHSASDRGELSEGNSDEVRVKRLEHERPLRRIENQRGNLGEFPGFPIHDSRGIAPRSFEQIHFAIDDFLLPSHHPHTSQAIEHPFKSLLNQVLECVKEQFGPFPLGYFVVEEEGLRLDLPYGLLSL